MDSFQRIRSLYFAVNVSKLESAKINLVPHYKNSGQIEVRFVPKAPNFFWLGISIRTERNIRWTAAAAIRASVWLSNISSSTISRRHNIATPSDRYRTCLTRASDILSACSRWTGSHRCASLASRTPPFPHRLLMTWNRRTFRLSAMPMINLEKVLITI